MKTLALKVLFFSVGVTFWIEANQPDAFGQDAIMYTLSDYTLKWMIDQEKMLACPRCRRAQPPGPLKRPHPIVVESAKVC